ncbi:hypothetical protein Pflav_043430 [Phytohabitans flavus]|uniref:Uncharacterized protein n=1 Tax=Phytohabitans flavus TaxID=1076124 RepID=A0A6F8XVU3_9ACTN|nr:hypothetical protein Pflav_043430 [Phytohabitans flavus]
MDRPPAMSTKMTRTLQLTPTGTPAIRPSRKLAVTGMHSRYPAMDAVAPADGYPGQGETNPPASPHSGGGGG